jgi:hypothetical protein
VTKSALLETLKAEKLAAERAMARRADAHCREFWREQGRKAKQEVQDAKWETHLVREELRLAERKIRGLEAEVALLKSRSEPSKLDRPANGPGSPPEYVQHLRAVRQRGTSIAGQRGLQSLSELYANLEKRASQLPEPGSGG